MKWDSACTHSAHRCAQSNHSSHYSNQSDEDEWNTRPSCPPTNRKNYTNTCALAKILGNYTWHILCQDKGIPSLVHFIINRLVIVFISLTGKISYCVDFPLLLTSLTTYFSRFSTVFSLREPQGKKKEIRKEQNQFLTVYKTNCVNQQPRYI